MQRTFLTIMNATHARVSIRAFQSVTESSRTSHRVLWCNAQRGVGHEVAMRKNAVQAVLRLNDRELIAEFQSVTGRLVVYQGSTILEDVHPPDSWMALALINCGSGWGTRPGSDDLLAFLERYVAVNPQLRAP
ncbi:hypothetical protein [Caballeronia novacaledonica]|nr:hypothetical protein [Caballeronia novacaledonica]